MLENDAIQRAWFMSKKRKCETKMWKPRNLIWSFGIFYIFFDHFSFRFDFNSRRSVIAVEIRFTT